MRTLDPSHLKQIPAFVHRKLHEILPVLAESRKRCVLYPGGVLTKALLGSGILADINVVGVVDKAAGANTPPLSGQQVVSPENIAQLQPEIILIASAAFHLEIITELNHKLGHSSYELLDLCEDAPDHSSINGHLGEIEQKLVHLEKLHTLACQAETRAILAEPRYQDPRRLERFGYRCYSQHDEDGMLAEILRRLGPAVPKKFVEFGVGDGLENNTLLLLKLGWEGLWIEGSPVSAQKIRTHFKDSIAQQRLKFEQAFIDRDNINTLIGTHYQGSIGVLGVDIDGNDYYVWEAIQVISPAVVIIEYNAKFPPPIRWTIEYNPTHEWDFTDYQGASLAALADLGDKKGYQLVGCNINGTNAFFVQKSLLNDKFIISEDLMDYYHPARYYLTEGYRWMSGHKPDPRLGVTL